MHIHKGIFSSSIITALVLFGSGALFAADRAQPLQRQVVPGQAKPNLEQATRPVTKFYCTYHTTVSGLPKPMGNGVISYGLSIDVLNKGTTTVVSAHGKITAGGITKICSIPQGMLMNQYIVKPGEQETIQLNCGSEQNGSLRVAYSWVYLKGNGKTFTCTKKIPKAPVPR